MKIKVNNKTSQILFGGKDNLVKFPFHKEIKAFFKTHLNDFRHTERYKTQEVSCSCGWFVKTSEILDKCESCLSPNITYKRLWDGSIYLIDKKLQFGTGFLPDVYEFLKDHYEIEFIDNRDNMVTIPETLINDFNNWELREDQSLVMDMVLNYKVGPLEFPRGIIDAATNYGKTILMYAITKNLNCNTLMIVNQKLLYKQIREKFSNMGIELSDIDNPGKFTLCMEKTLNNRSKGINVKSFLNKVQLLLVDECHGAKTTTMKNIIRQTNAYARFFVSGTPLDSSSELDNLEIISQSGPVLVKISNQDLIESGISQKVILYICNYHTDVKIFHTYKQEFDYLFNLKMPLVNDICQIHKGEKVLIILEFKEHGNRLKEYLNSQGVNCEFTYGDDPEKDIKIENFKDEKDIVLISSIIMNQAIDISDINVGVNLLGGKSITRAKQFAGRILRNDHINDSCTIYEFKDPGHYTEQHYKIREKLYIKELFDIKFLF